MSAITYVTNRFKKDNEALLTSVNELVYFYRGGYSYERGLMVSPMERENALKVLNKRLEQASKMQNPVF